MCQFYHHHFDQISEMQKIPLTDFYHPNKKTRPGLVCGQKTFNLSYVRLVLKSKSFKADAREYHKIFVQDCMKDRDKKVGSFKAALLKCMNNNYGNQEQLIRYLQSSQCKIPWTSREIQEAWFLAQRELDEHHDEAPDIIAAKQKDQKCEPPSFLMD